MFRDLVVGVLHALQQPPSLEAQAAAAESLTPDVKTMQSMVETSEADKEKKRERYIANR